MTPTDLIKESKIAEVAEEIIQCRIEASFNVRWQVIEMHNYIGKLLIDNFEENLAEVLPTLAKKCKWSDRSLYRAAEFYKKYPDLAKIPNGKAASFNRLMASPVKDTLCTHTCKYHKKVLFT